MGPKTGYIKTASTRGALSSSARIQKLLDAGEIREACRLATDAVALYPGDSNLRETHRILNGNGTVKLPATGHDIREEIEWLKDPPRKYRGRWVALIGPRVVACADTAKELEASLPAGLEQVPLAVEIAD